MSGVDWIISDTHFAHQRIRDYEPMRQAWGANVDEMTETMISAWNAVVAPTDTVLHLGDFALGGSEQVRTIRARLHGRIVLVRGNHDPTNAARLAEIADEVHHRLAFKALGLRFVCRHDPHNFTAEDATADVLLHGHLHSNQHRGDTPEAIRAKARCASVEVLPSAPAPMAFAEFVARSSGR